VGALGKELENGGVECVQLELEPVSRKGELESISFYISRKDGVKGAVFEATFDPKFACLQLRVSGSFSIPIKAFAAEDLKRMSKKHRFGVVELLYFRYDETKDRTVRAVAEVAKNGSTGKLSTVIRIEHPRLCLFADDWKVS